MADTLHVENAALTDSLTFAPNMGYVMDVNGIQVVLPRLTARLEFPCQRILAQHLRLLQQGEDWPVLDWTRLTPTDLVRIIPIVLEQAPGLITELASVLLQMPPTDVESRFTSETLLEVITPFLSHSVRYLTRLVRSIGLPVSPNGPGPSVISSSPFVPPTAGP